jgi:hypothetical protein
VLLKLNEIEKWKSEGKGIESKQNKKNNNNHNHINNNNNNNPIKFSLIIIIIRNMNYLNLRMPSHVS